MKALDPLTERQQVEQALGESEQRYRRLLAATTDYIYTVNVEYGRVGATSHGPGCAAVTGYTSAEFAADSYLWFRVIHIEDREAVVAQANRILAGEEPPPLEHRLVHKQGGVRWVRNTPIPRRDAEGRLIAYDGLISDITSHKRAEMFITAEHTVMATLATASRLDAALPTVLQAIGTILLWHFAACWQWNHATKEMCLQAVWSRPPLQAGVGSPSPLDVRARVAMTGQPVWIPDAAQLEGGQFVSGAGDLHCGCLIPVQVEGSVASVLEMWSCETLAPDAELLQVLVTVGAQLGQFIGRQRALECLEHERHLLRTVVDNLPDCIFVKDTESRFLLNNAAHLRMLGAATREYALGKTDQEFFPPALAAQYRADEEAVLRSNQPLCNHEEPAVDRAGRSAWFLTTKVPLMDGSGKLIGLVGIARDITERKAAAQQLQQANARLERRGMILKNIVRELKASHKELKDTQRYLIQTAKLESLGTVAAGVAHEVKNPLQTLLMGVDYLGTRFVEPDENLGLVLNDMRDAIQRANSIIGELLSLSADTDLCWVLEDVNNVVQRSLALIKSTLIAARTIVHLELATALPHLTIDRQKLQQVFINILLNGVQAMTGGGTLTVRSRAQPLDATAARELLFRKFKVGDTLVIVEVQDTGTGLTDAVLARVFDPFFTTKPVGAGTGLGLSVAKKIVELHGGSIEIKNAPDCGALVTVVLKV